ncbi:proline dehydrogenase family protein [Halorubrum lacusprofundi]|jgi:proline dehydrogenase|uniref:proline dehydrogenase n=1 Tax=Halorubrum lacusprofundi (strain ATCC 49239 / DSM 5036 / JCM 8891 / ACAM 34) TaxID=416348 RepID=B9LN06_HALLT|nr:proline dehydrogenase family protein [Halorubrum lacusprofundi]ACM56744.1 Proline dehydrogenase [Halorubrum lacusprofundi ATCC 49239]MCG1004993.1 proline dehydrogenase family protein [Halorubrum lacusprofundi]
MIPPIASNFVAGETPEAALAHVESLNDRGVAGILNLLGEHYAERPPADADADAYVDLVESIADRGIDACVSVKSSQIGLDIGDDVFQENLARIVDAANAPAATGPDGTGTFVWIDMEDHETTDVTLDAFERHAIETDGNVGVCVQANLKRTREDLERLADLPGKVRLVKGAYDEPAAISYKKKARVDESYRDCLAYMFETFDDGVAVGSHDPAMIEYASELHAEHGTPYEVQMLMGVREAAQFDLAADPDVDAEVYQYIPYGSKWFSYFYRRIRERKSNALFALRAIVGR